ncbi:MAG: hypothetical protein ABJC13_17975 [Acidobacteriota bacterium]
MGRPRKETPIVPTGPKCYPVTVASADEQRAFEAMAEHQNRPDVGTWLRDLARGYVCRYFSKRTPSAEGADA